MKKYPNSRVNVSWKPNHMVNEGCEYSTKSLDGSKTSSAYTRWWGIFERCYNPLNPGYPVYGQRGVTVNPVWGNFQDFAKWYYNECEQLGIDPENNSYQVDKDTGDTKEYGPTTCRLIPVSENVAKANSKDHAYISPTGERVIINNLNKFCRENGLVRRQMYRLRNGQCQSHAGWRYDHAYYLA